MKTKMKMLAVLGLISVLPVAGAFAQDAAKDQMKERDQLKTQDQLKERDQLKTQDQLKERDQLRTREQLKEQDKAGTGEKVQTKKQTRTREMTGADNGKGETVREAARNAGEKQTLKNQEKAASKFVKKAFSSEKAAERRRAIAAERRAARSENRGMGGKRK